MTAVLKMFWARQDRPCKQKKENDFTFLGKTEKLYLAYFKYVLKKSDPAQLFQIQKDCPKAVLYMM